jgi:hypothetical protein
MPSQEVCAANTVTQYQGNKACVSSCTFIPKVEPNMMICAIKDEVDLANVKPGLPGEEYANGDFAVLYTWYFFAVLNACLPTSFPDNNV